MGVIKPSIVTALVSLSGWAHAGNLPFYTCDKTSVSYGQTLHARNYAQGLSDSSFIPVAWVNSKTSLTIVFQTSVVDNEIKVRLVGYEQSNPRPVIYGQSAKMGEVVSLQLADHQTSVSCFATGITGGSF